MNRIRIHVVPSVRGRPSPPAMSRPAEPQCCASRSRPCSQPRLHGRAFCLRHILEDRAAPFRQCAYVAARSGRRCPNAAPKAERRDGAVLCAEHARRSALALQAQMKKSNPGPAGEALLSQLSSYARTEPGGDGARSEASRVLAAMNRIRIHVVPSVRGRPSPPAMSRPAEPQCCASRSRPCSQPRLHGRAFCLRHILEDRAAPFRQCAYVAARSGRRCPNAAPKAERRDGAVLCAEHARRSALALQAQMKKSNPGPAGEALLSQLSSYARTEPGGDGARSEASRVLDEDGWSDGEQEPLTVEQTWRGDPDSEADSIDSDQEDPLKHAGVYTAEEVALIMREKLIRLQSLYIDQFKRLQHLLKERKRRYLHSSKAEHDAVGRSLLTGPEGLTAKERENLKRLKCLRRYRQRHGPEALLHRQLRERRAAADGTAHMAHTTRSSQRCSAFVDDVRCSNPSLPMTRHCLAHICQDPSQALFRPCRGSEDAPCSRAVPVSLAAEPCCPLHLRLPPQMYVPPEQLLAGPAGLYLSAAELQPTDSVPLELSDDLDVVGDGAQCPPSPLLFDPSARDAPEAPVDILALEDPPHADPTDRGTHGRPTAAPTPGTPRPEDPPPNGTLQPSAVS